MSGIEYDAPGVESTASRSVSRIAGIGAGLVALNVVAILALSYTPVAPLGAMLFSNFFIGIAVFVVTVGGGYWLATTGIEKGSLPLAGAGVALTQFGYALIGSAILFRVASSSMRLTALGITTVVTGLITAAVTVAVFGTSHSFERWQMYSWVCFGGGFVVGAIGFFVNPTIMLAAGALFLLGFIVDLTYEIWAVRESKYGDLRSAIGIYIAVMGVFIHILQLVLRVLEMLDA
ncbi:hypothetical protein [Halosimplex salinum]|uniref:hypothetical protein n=1 Tax=Halosimplex salinum TaxID=1710538 RepID=UPI000F4A48E4|nr:hypothetical protein [Halosimplex salinum]